MAKQVDTNMDANIASLAKGLLMTGTGEAAKREGRALSCASLVLMLKENVGSPNVDVMLRYMQGIHVNGKNEPEVFDAAWSYWKDLLSAAKKVPEFTAKTAKELEDLSDRREENTKVGQAVRTLRDACAVAYAFHVAHVNWEKVLSVKGDAAVIAIDQDNAMRLFGTKKEKTIAKMHLGIVVDTYGQFNWNALISEGNERLIAAKVKAAPRRPEEKRTPVRDVVTATTKAIEDADIKSLKDDKLALLALLVTIIDRVNDIDMGEAYIPTSVTKSARDTAEAKIVANQEALDAKIKASVLGKAA